MKRQSMLTHVDACEFRYESDAKKYGDPANDLETCDVLVDADVEAADRSVGAFHPHVEINEVLTTSAEDIRELLTEAALERLADRYLKWKHERAVSAYESWVDYKIKERKEEKV